MGMAGASEPFGCVRSMPTHLTRQPVPALYLGKGRGCHTGLLTLSTHFRMLTSPTALLRWGLDGIPQTLRN